MRRPSRSVTRARESRRPGRHLHLTTSNWLGILRPSLRLNLSVRTCILGVARAVPALAPALLAYAPTGALAAVLVAALGSSPATSQSASSGRQAQPKMR